MKEFFKANNDAMCCCLVLRLRVLVFAYLKAKTRLERKHDISCLDLRLHFSSLARRCCFVPVAARIDLVEASTRLLVLYGRCVTKGKGRITRGGIFQSSVASKHCDPQSLVVLHSAVKPFCPPLTLRTTRTSLRRRCKNPCAGTRTPASWT